MTVRWHVIHIEKIGKKELTGDDRLFWYYVSFSIGDLVDHIFLLCLEPLEILQDRLQLILPVPPGDYIRGVRLGIFRGSGKQLAGIALAGDLEIGNFVEIKGFELPCMERTRLRESYEDRHANPPGMTCLQRV